MFKIIRIAIDPSACDKMIELGNGRIEVGVSNMVSVLLIFATIEGQGSSRPCAQLVSRSLYTTNTEDLHNQHASPFIFSI